MNAQSTAVATVHEAPRKSVLLDMSNRYGMEPAAFEATVRATCIAKASKEEFAAFLLVAKEYGLNPLTREIFAFTGRGGIVPIVSVDGWINLINSHPQSDGFEFDFEHDEASKLVSCTCRMYRKDRTRPVVVKEYLAECVRSTEPWKMQHRMLRHKTLIQAARYAFGFAGIYDEDEAQKIVEIRSREIQGEYTEVDDGGVPPVPANDDGGGPPVPTEEGTTGAAVDDGGSPPVPVEEKKAADDGLDIPDYLRRTPPAREVPSERTWLANLDAKLGECNDMSSLAEVQNELMTPYESKVSDESWSIANDHLQSHIDRLNDVEEWAESQ